MFTSWDWRWLRATWKGQDKAISQRHTIQFNSASINSAATIFCTLRMEPGTQRYTTQTSKGDRYLDNSKWTCKSPWQGRSRLLWEHSRDTYKPGLGNQGRLCKCKTHMYVLIPTVWQTKVRLTKRLSKLPKITCPISGWARISPKSVWLFSRVKRERPCPMALCRAWVQCRDLSGKPFHW